MLTAIQQALQTDLAAQAATVTINGVATAIKDVPKTQDNAFVVRDWYNQQAFPGYYVVRTDAPVADILNGIVWTNYTPNVALTASLTAAQASQCTAASGYCDNKQFNLQLLLLGRTTFDATKKLQTNGLMDATTALPSGANFNLRDAGWTNIFPVLQRQCTNAEKLLVTASNITALQGAVQTRGTQYDGTNGNPDIPVFQGQVSNTDIAIAWGIQ